MDSNFRAFKSMIFSALLAVFFCAPAHAQAGPASACAVDPAWFTSPSMPAEVAKSDGNSSNFCDFYQFSWQAFAYLMATSPEDKAKRNFEVDAVFPILEFGATGNPENSCDDIKSGSGMRMSLDKTGNIPESVGQAGGGATIYDQNGNVVYYEVRFSKNMCDVNSIKTMKNFPAGTTEIKLAWKQIAKADQKNDFIRMTTTIGAVKTPVTLGLIGMHIAIATKNHPEFVWATFEHQNNSPDCSGKNASSGQNWLFASKACAKAIANKDPLAIVQCKFNIASKNSAITSTATEICREYVYGTASGDPHAATNIADIAALNRGAQPYLKDTSKGRFNVLKNYFNVGALWVSDPGQGSAIGNQRGSLRLANTVAETVYQDVNTHSKGFISNCFGCHNYEGKNSNLNKNTTTGSLSHIFDDIAIGKSGKKGFCMDVQAGPIWNNADAGKKCPKTCEDVSSRFTWNGQWTTTKPNVMSVCGCCTS